MAKKAAVKEKYAGHKGPMPGIEVKTPYPNVNKDLGSFAFIPYIIIGANWLEESTRTYL